MTYAAWFALGIVAPFTYLFAGLTIARFITMESSDDRS